MSDVVDKLQTDFLDQLIQNEIPVSVFLVNGIKLCGIITQYDRYSVLLEERGGQLIFKHCISTIVPTYRDF